jgi:hypothetical protein
MGIEPGQLRQWKDDVDGLEGPFIVLRSEGMLYPTGARRGDPQQEHWELLTVAGPMTGWSERLLTELSEVVNEAR